MTTGKESDESFSDCDVILTEKGAEPIDETKVETVEASSKFDP